MIGKLIPPINVVMLWEKLDTHTRSIPRRIVPEVIFQKSLNAREITLAKSPTISRNPRKREITISQAFAITKSG
jgi:hypothetical protein